MKMKISNESMADLVAIKLKSFLSPLSVSYEKKPRLVNPTWVVQPLLLKKKKKKKSGGKIITERERDEGQRRGPWGCVERLILSRSGNDRNCSDLIN